MSHFLSVSFSMIRGGHNYSEEWKPPQRAWWKEWAVLCIRGHTGPAEDTKATSICVFHTLQLCRHPPATHTHTRKHTSLTCTTYTKIHLQEKCVLIHFCCCTFHGLCTKKFASSTQWKQSKDSKTLRALTYCSRKCHARFCALLWYLWGDFSFCRYQEDKCFTSTTATHLYSVSHHSHLVAEVASPDIGNKYTQKPCTLTVSDWYLHPSWENVRPPSPHRFFSLWKEAVLQTGTLWISFIIPLFSLYILQECKQSEIQWWGSKHARTHACTVHTHIYRRLGKHTNNTRSEQDACWQRL